MKVQVERTIRRVVKMRYEDGILKVVAYCFLSNRKLRQIIEENADWIRQRKQEALALQAAQNKTESATIQTKKKRSSTTRSQSSSPMYDIIAGKKTVILGDIINVACSASAKTYLEGNTLYINEKYCQSREARLKAIKSYLKKIAQLYISVEIANMGSSVSLCPVKIDFREIGDFWLKCSSAAQRNVCFDYRIVQLPQELRTYLIAHAFAHFTHPLHDDKFWNFISNLLPHYQDKIKQLDSYRFLLDT